MYIKTKGCKNCEEAKKAFILVNKVGFKNISIMCNYCETIWKLEDESLPNSRSSDEDSLIN